MQTQFKDIDALREAVESFGLKLTEGGHCRFYSGSPAVDYLVTLPGTYDVGFKVQGDGSLSLLCDSELLKEKIYTGKPSEAYKLWGAGFVGLKDAYSANLITSTYRAQGYSVFRETREDGSIKVTAQRG